VSRQKLTAKLLENLESEINILKSIHQRNIVALLDCFVRPHSTGGHVMADDIEKRLQYISGDGVLLWLGSLDIYQEEGQDTFLGVSTSGIGGWAKGVLASSGIRGIGREGYQALFGAAR
jgi:hypothetical protein